MIRLLHEVGADVNTANNNGATAVFVAAQNGHSKAVKLLNKLGADMTVSSSKYGTPADLAKRNGNTDLAQKLTEYAEACCECCKAGGPSVKLVYCSKCKKVTYCSVACQKQDRKKHKETCCA